MGTGSFTCSYAQDTYSDLRKHSVSAGRPINLVSRRPVTVFGVTFPGSRLSGTGGYGLDHEAGYPCLAAVTFRTRALTCRNITFPQVDQFIWYSRTGYTMREQGRLPAVTFRIRVLTCGNTTFPQVDQLIWYSEMGYMMWEQGRLPAVTLRIRILTCGFIMFPQVDQLIGHHDVRLRYSGDVPREPITGYGWLRTGSRGWIPLFTCSYVQDTYSDLRFYNVSAGRPINLVFRDGIRDVGIGLFTCSYV